MPEERRADTSRAAAVLVGQRILFGARLRLDILKGLDAHLLTIVGLVGVMVAHRILIPVIRVQFSDRAASFFSALSVSLSLSCPCVVWACSAAQNSAAGAGAASRNLPQNLCDGVAAAGALQSHCADGQLLDSGLRRRRPPPRMRHFSA